MATAFEHYIPSATQVQQAEALIALLKQCDEAGIIVTVFGGYGLDALYGQLTREHRDFDLVIAPGLKPKLHEVLVSQGYIHMPAWSEPGHKAIYTHPQLAAPFAAEVAILDRAMIGYFAQQLGVVIEDAALFPIMPNGRLLDYPIRTPTVVGVEIVNQIQQQRGQARGWTEFAHRDHQQALIAFLKQRHS